MARRRRTTTKRRHKGLTPAKKKTVRKAIASIKRALKA
jgi:hypothetical protein